MSRTMTCVSLLDIQSHLQLKEATDRNDIKRIAGDCEECQTLATARQKETLMSIESTVPWKKADTDLLSWSGKDYLLSAHDRIISRFLGIPQLNDTKATVVILFSKGTLLNMRNPVHPDQRQRTIVHGSTIPEVSV